MTPINLSKHNKNPNQTCKRLAKANQSYTSTFLFPAGLVPRLPNKMVWLCLILCNYHIKIATNRFDTSKYTSVTDYDGAVVSAYVTNFMKSRKSSFSGRVPRHVYISTCPGCSRAVQLHWQLPAEPGVNSDVPGLLNHTRMWGGRKSQLLLVSASRLWWRSD